MKKRLTSLLLVLCMLATLIPLPAMAAAFDDTAEHWAKAGIEHLAEKNIVRGSQGKFRPDDTITRAEVAQIFDNLMDYQTASDKFFTDLPDNAWYTEAVKKAVASSVFAGDGDGRITPLGKTTRQEFFVTLARVLQLADSSKTPGFSDAADIATWAMPKLAALTEAGLLTGVQNPNGTFSVNPLAPITRAEVAVMLDRAFPSIFSSADTYTQPVTGNAVVNKAGVKLDGVTVSGDLFIAPGVANGEVTLHSAKVAGRTMVYGGGKNSLLINGESALQALIAAKQAGETPLAIKLFDKSTVETITIVEGSTQTTVIVNEGATLGRLVIENEGTVVEGVGTVKVVEVNANNTVITTPNTKVIVAAGVTGTMVGDKPVAGGATVTTNNNGTGTQRPGGGGGPVQPANTWAVRFETNGGEYLAPIYVVKGLKLDPVPQAAKKDNLFLGWYTDAGLTTQFYASEVLAADITLYAKYEVIEKKQEQKVDAFALSDVQPGKTFTVSAPGMTAEQVRNAITVTNVGAGGTPELVVTPGSNGTFSISAKDDFREGSAVTLHLGDGVNFAEKDAEGNPMSAGIRNASFTVEKANANNMKLNEDLTKVKIDPAVVKDIVPPKQTVSKDENEHTVTTTEPGSFTVIGDKLGEKTLAPGAMFVLYETIEPENRTDITKDYSDDTIIYAKITTVDKDNNPANGNQVVYDVVEDSELMDMPESLPLDVTDFVALSYTDKNDTNFDIPNTTLNKYWKDYDHINLSATTTIDVGDTIILMGVGEVKNDEVTEDNVVYGKVATVTPGDTNTTVTFTPTTADAIMSNKQDFYSNQEFDYTEIVTKATEDGIPAQIEEQAMKSGFVEDAVTYLTEVATQTEGFKTAAARVGPDMDIGTPGFGNDWHPNVSLPKSLTEGFDVKARITKDGDHYHGLMCQLYVAGKVEIPLDKEALFSDKLVIDMKATFEQELKINVNMDGGIEWSWAAFIPYPSDIYVNTNVDVFDYTAIKVQAHVTTKGGSDVLGGVLAGIEDMDISGEIQDLLSMTDSEAQMSGTEKLFGMYGAMLETETDYVTLVEQEIFNAGGTYFGILAYGVKGDFVISANVNLVIGSSLTYESGNRYNFWFKLFSGTSGSSTTRLIDEQMKFQFYIMGTIGLKVGISLEIFVAISPGGKCNLASIGFGVDVGAYVELYGYFVYEVTSLNKVTNSEMAGALYVDFGIYLEIYFFARAGEDVAGGLAEYQPTLFDKKWPLISAGEKINVYDFTYEEIPATELYIIKNYTTDYLPDSYWSMKGMDLLSGDLVDLIYPRDRFVYTFSNPAFEFNVKEGKVEVKVPTNTRYMTCEMTIKWAGAKLAFSTEDLVRTVHLVWTNLADEEMSLRHNISVVADGKVIWSKVVGEGEQYELPNVEDLAKLLEYGKFMYKGKDLKYDTAKSTLTYTNEQGNNKVLNADRDRIYTVNVTPRVYELPIAKVQNADGTENASFKLTGKFGEPFDLTPLLASGTNAPSKQGEKEKPFTVYARTKCVEKVTTTPPTGETAPVGRPLDNPIDVGFAKQIIDGTFTYTAQYNDNFVTATYNFMDSRGNKLGTPQVIKVEMDNYPEFDYQAYALTMENGKTYMVKRFDKTIEKLTADETYSATCVLAIGEAYPIVFGTGDDAVNVTSINRHNGAHLTLPRPERPGYTFAGWYEDEQLNVPFTKTNMTEPPKPNSDDEKITLDAAKAAAVKAATDKTAADGVVTTATQADTNAQTAKSDATTADGTAKSDLATATQTDTDAKAAVVAAQGVLKSAQEALAADSENQELKNAVTAAEGALATKTTEAENAATALIEKAAAAKTAADTLATKTAEAATAAKALTDATNAATDAAAAKLTADNAKAAAQEAFDKADTPTLTAAVNAAKTAATDAGTAKDTADGNVTAATAERDRLQGIVDTAGENATQEQKNAVIAAQNELNTKTGLAADAATAKTNADNALTAAKAALAAATAQVLHLYADWTANTYKVTFDANAPGANVTGTPAGKTVTFGESYGNLRDLNRSGYKFLGWSTARDGNLVSNVAVHNDHVLYAKWTMKKVIPDKYFTNFANTKDDGTGDVVVTVSYNKAAHPYVPAKADGADPAVELKTFIVQYKGSNPVYSANRWLWFAEKDENGEAVKGKQNVGPIDSERYDVMLYRPEDADYQMYKRVVPAGVTISKIDRPEGVTITLPNKAITATYNSVTVNEATATSTVPGADAGKMSYQMKTLMITKMAGQVFKADLLETTEWTDSRTLQSAIDNTQRIGTPGASEIYLERRISAKLADARNYNDQTATGSFAVETSAPLKDTSKEIKSNVHIEIKTSDKSSSGTGSNICMDLLDYRAVGKANWGDYENYRVFSNNQVLSGGYKTGELGKHDRTFSVDPWMLGGEFLLWKDGGTEEWRYDYTDFTFTNPIIGEKKVKTGYDSMDDSSRRDRKYKFAEPDAFQRTITNVGTFADWNGTHNVTAESKGKISYGYDGMIVDQYGKYVAYDHADTPTIKVGTIDKKTSTLVPSPFADCISYSNYGIEIDEAKLYARMAAAELSTVSFIVKLDVPTGSCTNAADKMFTQTITVTRDATPA